MKRIILLMAAIISMSACQTNSSDNQEIKNLLFTYRDALNASDVGKVLSLYTEGGIFMPSGAPTSIGTLNCQML